MAIFDDRRILRELIQRDGPVGRYLLAVASRSISNAQAIAQRELTRRGGADSYFLGWDVQLDRTNPSVVVSNKVPHAAFIEDGTRPHVIRPKPSNPTGRLWFIGTVKGRRTLIGVRQVNHPGTRAYNILNRAVQQALREPVNPNRSRRLP